jgi:hypothetical protein
LDVAQESRFLSNEEIDIDSRLKIRFIGLATLERTTKCQSSRVKNSNERDAHTRYFHIRINARKRKK